jgi:hypothetical protein
VKNGLLVNWAMMPPGAVSAPRSCLATSGFDATSISRQRAAEAKTGGQSPPCMVNDVYRRMTISPGVIVFFIHMLAGTCHLGRKSRRVIVGNSLSTILT